MSMASQRRARVGAAVDRTWGESFVLSPRCRPAGDPDARSGPDPGRTEFPVVGRFMSASAQEHARSRATSLQTTRAFETASPTLTVVKSALLDEVREGDQVLRVDTGEVFTITRVKDGGFERVVLTLRKGPR